MNYLWLVVVEEVDTVWIEVVVIVAAGVDVVAAVADSVVVDLWACGYCVSGAGTGGRGWGPSGSTGTADTAHLQATSEIKIIYTNTMFVGGQSCEQLETA